ncbi:MAG TPA: DUF937 domain-containing protein [Salinarimonas sp.]|nr:DUF937 domain-containing protein [Salinarimonas sp.]
MLNLLDFWQSSQAVAALEGAGRQIGLGPDQARAAAFALAPAFLMALRHNAVQRPSTFADLMRLTGTGAFAPLLEGGLSAFTPQRRAQAEDATTRLFGPEVAGLVERQAALMAGVAPEAVRQMMPLVTGLMFGGLSRAASTAATPSGEPSDPFSAMMRPWLATPEPTPPPPAPNPWEGFFSTMFGLPPAPGPRPEPAPAPPDPAPRDPFGDMMRALMGLPAPAPEPPPPEPEPVPDPEPAPPGAASAWGEALRVGQEAQNRHIEALQSIFERAWRPAEGRPDEP